MRRLFVCLCVLCLSLLVSAFAVLPARAQGSAAPAAGPPSQNEALLGGIVFYHARTDFAGRTRQQRAAQVQERLNMALSQGPIHPSDITVGQVEGDWAVLLKGRRFLTADPQSARENHSTPPALAAHWAAMLRKTLPFLTRPTNTRPLALKG